MAQGGNYFAPNAPRNNGNWNTFIGVEAGRNNIRGDQNTFIGSEAGKNNTTGRWNTFIGEETGYSNTSGNSNTFMGSEAGHSNTSGYRNTYIGIEAGENNTTGQWNTFIGSRAGISNATGRNNTFLGSDAGLNNSTGSYNIFIGYEAGLNENGSNKLFIANSRSNTLIYGDFSSERVGINTTSPGNTLDVAGGIDINNYIRHNGDENTYLGFSGNNEFRIYTNGSNSLTVKSTGRVGLGTSSPTENLHVIGAIRIGINNFDNPGTIRWTGEDFEGYDGDGWRSFTSIFQLPNQGSGNLFIGQDAGANNQPSDVDSQGNYNTFVGYGAGRNNTVGRYSTFLGEEAGFSNTTGAANTFQGRQSGLNNTEGNGNTFQGHHSGFSNVLGSYNLYLGRKSGFSNQEGSHNVFLGNEAGYNELGSHKLYIANERDNTLIYGEFAHDNVLAGVGVGTQDLPEMFNVSGALHIGNSRNQTSGTIRWTGEDFEGYDGNQWRTFTGKYDYGEGNYFAGLDAGSNVEANIDLLTGLYNTFVGASSGNNTTTGVYNTFLGYQSGFSSTVGTENTFLGYRSGRNSTGSRNTYVGYHAGINNDQGSGNVFIGYGAGAEEARSNRLHIANNTNSTLIYGEFSNGDTPGAVGIGTQNLLETLNLDGALRLGGNRNQEPGTLRWNVEASDFEGYDGEGWKSLTSNLLQLADNQLSIGNGNSVDLSVLVEDGDSDPENERISTFLLDGTELRITEGAETRLVDFEEMILERVQGWSVSEDNLLFAQSGNIGIGTEENPIRAKLEVIGGDVLFASRYAQRGNELRAEYMRWVSDKSAFRAGRPDGNAWDNGRIGRFSFAVGRGTVASGEYTSAFGARTSATAYAATSFGEYSRAEGQGSVSFGSYSEARGDYSVVFGERVNANSYGSVVFGRYNTMQESSRNSWEEEDYLLVVGNGVDENNRNNALSLYKNGNLEMNGAYPFDEDRDGIDEMLPNQFSWNSSRGSMRLNALVTPLEEQEGFGSISVGRQTTSEGWFSAAFGDNVSSENRTSFVVGAYNELDEEGNPGNDQPDDYIFAIGNGSEGRRSNAVTVLRNGNTDINGNVTVENLINNSDRRYKKNINKLKSPSKLGKLNGVQYNLKKSKDDRLEFGFIAQELQKVYPNLVYEDKKGYLGVNYVGLIPLLTEAYKELKSDYQELKNEFEELKSKSSLKEDWLKIKKAKLFQNRPNPFTENTTIEFVLPEDIQKAELYIYNMNGQQLRSYSINQRGNGAVEIHGGELKAGMYLYSLIADDEEIGTERMILTR